MATIINAESWHWIEQFLLFNLSPNLQKFVSLLTLVRQFDNYDETPDKMA